MYNIKLKEVCGCNVELSESVREELISKVKEHAKSVHGMQQIPEELAQKVNKAINSW